MLPEVPATLARILEVHAGDPWHGPSISYLLGDVTAKQAAARPAAGVHSIWEILLHITAWTNEVRARLAGGQPGDPAEGDWPAVGDQSEEGWREAVAGLDAAHKALAQTVARVDDASWHTKLGAAREAAQGTGKTRLETLEGLALHHAYHAGQIGLLKRWTAEAGL